MRRLGCYFLAIFSVVGHIVAIVTGAVELHGSVSRFKFVTDFSSYPLR